MTASMLVLAALAGSASAGCARRDQAAGGGEKVGFCEAYKAYDGLSEPASDPGDVTRYADSVIRVVDRVDRQVRVDGQTLPDVVVKDLETMRASMKTFATHYRAAGADAAKQTAAEATLTSDAGYAQADQQLTAFSSAHCRAKSRLPSGGPGALPASAVTRSAT